MTWETWLAFVAASGLLLAIPGPTVLLVLAYAVSQGRRIALAVAAGVALGDLIAMSATLAGLGALALASASLFAALKWAGAAYLAWLGIGLIRGARRDAGAETLPPPPPARPRAVFAHACAVTALNPKSIAFFIAFVPQFLSPAAPLLPQAALLTASFVGLAALNALAYALAGAALGARIGRPSARVWMARLGGGALLAMAAATATLRRAAA